MNREPTLLLLSVDLFRLGVEAHTVMGLRIIRAATGSAEPREISRMISEKMSAFADAQAVSALAFAVGGPAIAAERVIRSNKLGLFHSVKMVGCGDRI